MCRLIRKNPPAFYGSLLVGRRRGAADRSGWLYCQFLAVAGGLAERASAIMVRGFVAWTIAAIVPRQHGARIDSQPSPHVLTVVHGPHVLHIAAKDALVAAEVLAHASKQAPVNAPVTTEVASVDRYLGAWQNLSVASENPLLQIIAQRLNTFIAERLAEQRALPAYVLKEFEAPL